MDGYEGLARVTVAVAAERLGVKERAIRKCIARGTLAHDKEPDGWVYVYVDTDLEDEVQGSATQDDTHLDVLVDGLQDHVRFLREELARKDALMLNMTETMRQLTAPTGEGSPEARDSPETAMGPVGRSLHRRSHRNPHSGADFGPGCSGLQTSDGRGYDAHLAMYSYRVLASHLN